jgi:hypothetical protein
MLSTHAQKIKDCKHFLSVGKTHMDEAAKKVGIAQNVYGDFLRPYQGTDS